MGTVLTFPRFEESGELGNLDLELLYEYDCIGCEEPNTIGSSTIVYRSDLLLESMFQ